MITANAIYLHSGGRILSRHWIKLAITALPLINLDLYTEKLLILSIHTQIITSTFTLLQQHSWLLRRRNCNKFKFYVTHIPCNRLITQYLIEQTSQSIMNNYLWLMLLLHQPDNTGYVHSFYTIKPLQLNHCVHEMKRITFSSSSQDILFEWKWQNWRRYLLAMEDNILFRVLNRMVVNWYTI